GAAVGLVTCTVKLEPEDRSTGPQLRVCWVWGEPEIEQFPPPDWDPIDQSTPLPAGRASFTVTFLAVPTPLSLTVTANPMGSPASTGEASAVLVMARLGQFTVVEAEAGWTGPGVVAEAEAAVG